MKWTPGTWKVAGRGDGNKRLPTLANGKIIAAIRDEGSLADARLIAAAPTLYALVRAHALAYPHDEYAEAIAEVVAQIEGEEV